ncbi:MAG: hypothetical protein EBR82_32115 [Caulobacteraceae bacterium]|nr:hypothetical protein [Caulobacteraceae bacterium]
MDLRTYQTRVVDFLAARQRAFAIAPAGSGKTIMAASAVSRVVKAGMRVGWLANTRDQVDQGIAAIQTVEGPLGVEFDFWCAAAQPDLSHLDVLVIDECHHLPAESWHSTFGTAHVGCRVFGFSATPWSDPARDALLVELFGGRENFVEVSMNEVRDSGHLAQGQVIFHDLEVPDMFRAEIEARAAPEIKRRCASKCARTGCVHRARRIHSGANRAARAHGPLKVQIAKAGRRCVPCGRVSGNGGYLSGRRGPRCPCSFRSGAAFWWPKSHQDHSASGPSDEAVRRQDSRDRA